MINMLVTLTENDKRLITALLLLLILVFVIIGYIGVLVKKIMDHQADLFDTMMHDMVITNVISNKKRFRKIGFRKIRERLFYEARIPFIILALAGLTWLFVYIGYGYNYRLIDAGNFVAYNKSCSGGTGFDTILYLWDWNAVESDRVKTTMSIFGLHMDFYWAPVYNVPHFEIRAIPSYFIFPSLIGGSVWFLVCVQAYIARVIRLFKRSKTIYEKSLEGYNQSKNSFNETK